MADILLPKPHTAQKPIRASKARFRVLACGRRFGKTVTGMLDAAEMVLRCGLPYGWFAPSYKYLTEPYRELKWRLAPVITGFTHNQYLEIMGRVRIDFWTLEDANAGRGFKYGGVGVDEAAMVPNLMEIWHEAIRPTLADLEGRAMFMSSPKGNNGFGKLFQHGLNGTAGWESFHMPTSANPHIPPAEYDREILLNGGMPERVYRQEYLAEFLDDAGGVFIGVDDVVQKGAAVSEMVLPVGRSFAGIDLAQTTDFTVITILDAQGNQIYFDRFNKLSWNATVERVANAIAMHKATALVDATGVGSPIYEALRDRGLAVDPFVFTAQSKAALIENAAATVQRKDVSLLDIPIQTSELKSYEYQVSKSGTVKLGAPEGLHDDCVIALALAIRAMERPRLVVGVA